MIILLFCVVVFGLVHTVPVIPAWREAAQNRLGTAFHPVHGMGLLILFGLCIWAFRTTATEGDIAFLSWGRHANFLLTWLAFLCVGIFLFRGSWRHALRFPMAIATLLWGTGHLLANIEPRAFIFFGGMMAFAVAYAALKSREPLAAPVIRNGHNLLSLLFGTALYGLMVQLHEVLIGVPVITLIK